MNGLHLLLITIIIFALSKNKKKTKLYRQFKVYKYNIVIIENEED